MVMNDKLPGDWEWKTLDEVLFLNFGERITKKNNTTGIYPVYGGGGASFETNKYNRENEYVVSRFAMSENCVRKVCGKFWMLDSGGTITKKRELDNIDYLGKFLISKQELVYRCSTGAAQKNLKNEEFYKIKIPLAPIFEQEQIVSVLDKTFEKLKLTIALVEENIQKLRQLNESVLDKVFSKLNREENKFRLVDIADVKRGKSKHRPRNDKSLYGGRYPLIQTGDIRNAEKFITRFSQTYNEKGLEQSKLWKKGTICLTIAANIGDVAILDIDACFPDSVVGIYSKEFNNTYIYYFLKSIQKQLDEKSSASAQKNLSVEKLSDFYIPLPSGDKQQRIAAYLDQIAEKNQKLIQYYQNKLKALKQLENSILDSAFKGELRKAKVISISQRTMDPFFAKKKNWNAKKNADKQVMIIALAMEAHEKIGKSLYRTKGEKTVEVIEKHIDLDFGREAKKMAAGPAAFEHLVKVVEPLAQEKKWFSVQEVKGENYDSHKYIKAENFNAFMMRCVLDLNPNLQEIRRVIDLFANMRTTHEAEVVATTYSGWNNLIIRKTQISDEAIVTEARENWHDSKLKIERQEFFNAIEWLKKNNLVPKGNGKEVL